MTEYDDAVALDPGATTGEHRGIFTDAWRIGNAVNGGLVMAAALTALGRRLASDPSEQTTHLDPVVLSAYFLTPSQPGPFTATTQVLRTGRMLSTGQVSIAQAENGATVERMRAMASFGNLEEVDTIKQAAPPDMPPPERCLSASDGPRPQFLDSSKFLDRVDLRLDPSTAGWAAGKPSMEGVMRGWLRLRDARDPDTTMLALALDAFPPVAFDLGLFGWTPTLEFTGHIRRRPAGGWLQVALSSENLGGGMMEEDARIWDSTGALVAQSRQLCGVRPNPATRG